MNFLKYFLKNTLENITRNKLLNIFCLSIISLTLLIFSIFSLLSQKLDEIGSRLKQEVEAIVYLKDNLSEAQIEKIRDIIQQSVLVSKIDYISAEAAFENFRRDFPELEYILTEFKTTPFPASFRIYFKKNISPLQIETFVSTLKRSGLIESIQINTDWIAKIFRLKKIISTLSFFLTLLLLFISAFIIFNVIRLNILYRQNEIHILKLVGATNLFIEMPFLIEGIFFGISGAFLSALFFFILLQLSPLIVKDIYPFIRNLLTFKVFWKEIFQQTVLLGSLLGFLSAFISIKQFVRKKIEL